MKIEFISASDTFYEENDYRGFYIVKIDGKKELGFLDGEPEDANLGRDFSDVFKIPALLERVSVAIANGEEITFVKRESDDWE